MLCTFKCTEKQSIEKYLKFNIINGIASEQEDQEWFLPLVFISFYTFLVRWQACLYFYNLFPHPFPLPSK